MLPGHLPACPCTGCAVPLSSYASRFWAFVEKGDGCWVWRGSRNADGYGSFGVASKPMRRITASRMAMALSGTHLLPGEFACHHCDNPTCVRPSHLFRGSARENAQDMGRKGRGRNQNWQKSTCDNGHELSGFNVGFFESSDGRTYRKCRRCHLERRGKTTPTQVCPMCNQTFRIVKIHMIRTHGVRSAPTRRNAQID
jgi:hypothetical protein